jgi:hypothetical protein
MFSAAKKPLSRPMKSGQRLPEGDPTVPTITVSSALARGIDIVVIRIKPSATRSSVLLIRMIIPPLHAVHGTPPTAIA